MSDFALMFPGQGSQTADMRGLVLQFRPDLFEAVGEEAFERAGESTRFAQPAIFCAGLAAWERAGRPEPAWLAGHSLGELAALVVGGALGEEDGLRLVRLRGNLMADTVTRDGGMVALLGATPDQAADIARRFGLTVANDNAPGQLVLSGPDVHRVEDAGVRTMPLAVEGAFHSADMQPAADAFAAALAETEIRPARVPVVSCSSARPFTDARAQLAEAVVAPVRWRQTLLTLHALGARRFVDAGPGKVLAGLARRTLQGVAVEALAAREPAHA